MSLRLITSFILLLFCNSLYAASCDAVFPDGFNLIGSGAEPFENIPPNSSNDNMFDGIVVPRGDNFFSQSNLNNGSEVFIGPISGSEVTSRIYVRNSANWHNVKINESGDPEDVIIYIAGSLSITGGNTEINAIIYVAGVVNQNGNGADISGAITAAAGSANVDYDDDAIENADFGDLCGGTSIGYPYTTDFEGNNTEWTFTGEWAINNNASGARIAKSPTQFLDNNPNEIDQRYYRNYYATLNQAISIPANAVNPTLRFAYKADLTSGDIYIQASRDGTTWQQIDRISEEYFHDSYTFHETNLNSFIGDNFQVRFRQYMHSGTGPRLFIIDDLTISDLSLPDLGYPYINGFETAQEQLEFNDESDWGINQAHDSYFPATGSYFLDNNSNNIDQRYHRQQSATLDGYITLPNDTTNVIASFDYRADLFLSDRVFFQIQEFGSNSWITLNTFDEQENHDDYTNYQHALTQYANKKVRFRYRQYYGSSSGPRLFSIDNFYVGTVPVEIYKYPYSNDFETTISTPSINGRDHWTNEGDWVIGQTHDVEYAPYRGDYFLDNNASNEDQRYHRNHYTRLNGFIPIPGDADAPILSFWYRPTIFSGVVDLQVQTQGSNTWQHLFRFSEQLSHEDYANHEVDLSNYKGSNVRFRFRQYWNSTNGARVFTIDDFYVGENNLPTLTYPYFNDFETPVSTVGVNGTDHWNDSADWGISQAHDTDYVPYSGSSFIDNNANYEDQRYHRNHYIDLQGFIPIPSDAEAPTLSFYYKADIFSGQTYVQIQEQGSNTWRTLTTFTEQLNHSTYARHEYALNSYIGKSVRFRFRQYWNSSNGPRVFTIDDFRVDELTRDTYSYPYVNDFETAISTDQINGQDHWNHQGDWNISQAHDDRYYPRSGNYFLDNNADNEDQRYHRNHYVEMNGFVPIPADAENPEVSFWYLADIFSGQAYAQLQVEGTNTWVTLRTFTDQFTHAKYARFSAPLDNYKGQAVRIRFRQFWNSSNGARVFTVDDFRIGDNDQPSLGYPYFNDLESPSSQQEFIDEHDWGISQEHDTDYVPFEGDWFIDNNADYEDQRYDRNHYVTLSGYVPIPSNATLPTLSFWYKANIFSGQVYVQIKRRNESVWRNLFTYRDEFNHGTYTQANFSLDNYKGDEVFIRFRQYWGSASGPRLFTIDNVRIGNFENLTYNYPYFNDFEMATSTASISGRDHWNDDGDWGLSNQNDVTEQSYSGDWFMNSNPDDEDQRYHRNHYTTMRGFVPIPSTANNPKVTFQYNASTFSGFVDLQIQRQGERNWRVLKRFDNDDTTTDYELYSYVLNQYKGESVRFRFRQYWHSSSGPRYFSIDDFFIGQDVLSLWYFEEDWLDSSGQGITLTPVNNPTFSNADRAKDGDNLSETSTCFYTEYNGTNYSRAQNTAQNSQLPELTVSLWAKTNVFSGVQALFTKGTGLGIYLNANGYVEWHYAGQIMTSTTPLVVDEWSHIAITFGPDDQKLYLNGGLNASASNTVTLSNIDQDIFLAAEFDGNAINASRNFNGDLDEVRVYFSVQDSAAINQDINTFHPCDIKSEPHHYEIEHNPTGLTCAAETATIKACMNDMCTELSDQSVSVDLIGNSQIKASTTFTGSTTVNFNHTSAEVLTLGLANESIPATDVTQCTNGLNTSCQMTFKNAGFRFLSSTGDLTIDTQTAGQAFNIKVQAVEDNNGVCEGLFNGNVNIKLAKQLASPTTEGLALTVGNTVVPSLPSYTPDIGVNFGAASTGDLTLTYLDAGQIRINASYSDGDISITGSSNPFWVKPSALVLSAQNIDGDIDGTSATASANHPAGVGFNFNVTAVNTNGDTTINYQPVDIEMSVGRLAPTDVGSIDGDFTYADSQSISSSVTPTFNDVTLTGFTNGVSSFVNANFSEVGVINIDLKDANYGDNQTIDAEAITVGRFTPAYYVQTIATVTDGGGQVSELNGSLHNNHNSSIISTCNLDQTFAYIGQKDASNSAIGSLRYNTTPQLEITAYNQQGIVTTNYLGDFVKLEDTSVDVLAPTTDTTAQGTDNNLLAMSGNINNGQIVQVNTGDGSVEYQLSTADNFHYLRSAISQVEPFTSSIELIVNSIIDSDGISANSMQNISPAGIEMRFGRMVVDNSFGPETANLRQVMQTQYLRNGQFITNTEDNCSVVTLANVSATSLGTSSVAGANGDILSGKNDTVVLSASNQEGDVIVIYNAPDWLKYTWTTSGNLDENPEGTASFGRYRGNDRVIHWREKGN
ncbi:hypothetical protein tloyanaT_00620 [Thalassotalea loyana]|uniref:DUF6701 domain-containing protein n=1 Tax=Thalassotalea loyana TaxID=280483 RepID=A0ABQ6H950_9GAMM|nr:LamG domain-containing protein [Thalassotalea loyana]GLX83810.1 hypothetical protein tloyanaT_00620 [Thalassotalea loyana]